jgi:signal transduction histidine kinase
MSVHAPIHALEQRSLERQVTLARPMLVFLALLSLLLSPPEPAAAIELLCAYLALSVVVALLQKYDAQRAWRVPLLADLIALGAFFFFTPSVAPVWFLLLIVAFAVGVGWGGRRAYAAAACLAAASLAWALIRGHARPNDLARAAGIALGTLVSGLGMAYLGDRSRRQAADSHFLSGLAAMLSVEHGVAESLRGLLAGLAEDFDCERAFLIHRDADLERIFLWRYLRGATEHLAPEVFPLTASDAFLLDAPQASVGWNGLNGEPGQGFAWDRATGDAIAEVPRVPAGAYELLGAKSLLAVTLNVQGEPSSRVMVANGRRRFRPHDLQRLERIIRHLGPPLENMFLLRHLRARAIDAERSRIARDLHDGILQTLLSIEIQLDVLRRTPAQSCDRTVAGIVALQQTAKNEGAELRRWITDLRPLHVQSADLLDLMHGFRERFENESNVHVDLLVDTTELQAPDRVCREVFQIYREALNNIKKHARATHVVVKLTQSDSLLVLVVDDNGEGFSFAGRFSGDELDRLRLGPISIKEHTRTVGGVLTVESTPGHGARLMVEIPLG